MALGAAIAAALLGQAGAGAADVYYDVIPSTADIDGGSANWSDANWKTTAGGTSGGSWVANDSAFFEAVVGSPTTTTITLGGAQTATTVTFNAAGYTITGGTLALAGGGATNWFTMNASGTIASALPVMRFKGSAEATISGGGALGGNRIVLGDSGGTTVTVRQTAGAITTSDYLMIGGNNVANARGHYVLDGGSLQVSSGAYLGWGNATSSGTFTQNGGTVTIGGQGLQLGIQGGSGTYILNSGTLDSYLGQFATTGGFTFGHNGTFKVAGGFDTQPGITTSIASGATAIIDTNGQTVTWDSTLNGPQAAGLTKSGFGTLNLTGNFTGNVTVNRGLLKVGNATSLGTGTITIPDVPVGTLASHGGAIDLNGFSFSNNFYVGNRSSGPADIGALGNRVAETLSVLSGDVLIGGENYGGGDGSIRFDGVVSGGVITHYAMYKQGTGIWSFTSEANTFEGFWYQAGGTTEVKKLANINQPSSLGQPTTSTNNRVVFNGDGGGILFTGSTASTSDREFVPQGSTNRIDASGTVAAATLTLTGNVTGGSGRTFALGGTNAGVNVYAGTIGNGTNVVLRKDGSTTWRLTNANTFTGSTTIAGGRLEVNGSIGGGAVTVQNGGALGGSGVIGGAVSVQSGGQLGPGNSIESLKTGTVTFASGATFAYEVNSTNSGSLNAAADLLVVSGNLNLDPGNGSILTVADLASSPNPFVQDTTVFALINYSGTWNGGLFTYAGTVLADDGQFKVGSQWWEIDYNRTSAAGLANFTGDYLPSSSFVAITAVPEPSTLVLLGFGVAALGLVRGRRMRRG
jgi:autotransporter-associated beta strand protein